MSVISKALTVNQQARGRMRNQLIRGRCHLRAPLGAFSRLLRLTPIGSSSPQGWGQFP